ncbi:MAG: VOC family protein, partial [Gemmatimonadota bacterium]
MPADIRLGPVRLQVSDLTRSRAWYERVLGLRLLGPVDRAARLGTPAGEPLVELVERAGAAPVRPRSRLGLFHFAILLPDRASLGRLVTHLARQSVPTGSADHRVSEALYLQDPDGLGIEVYADRPRSAWRHADRQLVMATDPLDRASLVSAAGGS